MVGICHVRTPLRDSGSACRPCRFRGPCVCGGRRAATNALAQVQAVVSASKDMIRHLRLQIAKLRRMQLEDIETDIADGNAKAEATATKENDLNMFMEYPFGDV